MQYRDIPVSIRQQTREKRMFSIPSMSDTRLSHQASWMCVPVTHDPTDHPDIARNDLRRQKILFKPQFD